MWNLQNPRGLTSGLTMPAERKAGEIFINEIDEKVFIKKTDTSSFQLNTKSVFDTHVLSALNTSHVVDDVTTGGSGSVLSAEQGKVLKGLIDNLNTLVASNDVDLNEVQEIVDFIKLNRSDLDALSIASIAGLQAALDSKATAADVSVLPTYTVANALTQRSYDANATTLDQLADVVATLAADINGGLIWPQWPQGIAGADGATYDDTTLTALVNTKANQATTYTKTEVDNAINNVGGWNITTSLIAWGNITAGQSIYINSTDWKVYLTDSSDLNKSWFVGFATETVTVWGNIQIDLVWINSNNTGLSIGSNYYISQAAGSLNIQHTDQHEVIWDWFQNESYWQTFTVTEAINISNIKIRGMFYHWVVVTCKVYDSVGWTLIKTSDNTYTWNFSDQDINYWFSNLLLNTWTYYIEFTMSDWSKTRRIYWDSTGSYSNWVFHKARASFGSYDMYFVISWTNTHSWIWAISVNPWDNSVKAGIAITANELLIK